MRSPESARRCGARDGFPGRPGRVMSGGPIFVQRARRFEVLSRVVAPLALRSLWTTGRHLLRNLRDAARRRTRYPERRPERVRGFRGLPVLPEGEPGVSRCTACGRCENVCPTGCLRVVPIVGECRAGRFTLDAARCLFCGLCEEVCPERALLASPVFELAGLDRATLRLEMRDLLVPEALLGVGPDVSSGRDDSARGIR